MKKYILLLFGTAFGFILSRAGATTYDYYAQLFLFQDLQLLWVIATAGGVGIIGIFILKSIKARSVFDGKPITFDGKARSVFDGKPITFDGKAYRSSLIPGSVIFGLGWGLAGACPGTVLAMLGEGKLGALFTIGGIVLGTYLYGLQESYRNKKAQQVQTGAQPAKS